MIIFLVVISLFFLTRVDGTPSYWVYGCQPGNVSSALRFCDYKLSVVDRVDNLLSLLTLDEKLGILGADKNYDDITCEMIDHGVKRLGIPHYMNLVETNSAVASACIEDGKCATNFPSPAAFASSFNRSLWLKKGQIMSDEMRALNNYNWYRGTNDGSGAEHISKLGLTGYGPNINLMRDPRWGRNSEVPSEDPILSGEYGSHMVKGMQEGSDPNYIKVISGLKHFMAYSVEEHRETFIPNITTFDLWDTYLMQYKIGFAKEATMEGYMGGNAHGVMSSYSGMNGVPACSNEFIITDVLRGAWERDDVVVATDCGAISNSINYQGYATSDQDAAAKALNAGTDLDLGDDYFQTRENGGNGGDAC